MVKWDRNTRKTRPGGPARAPLRTTAPGDAGQVGGAVWIAGVGGSVALILLMPLKRVEPFVIRVDNSTGIVDVVPVYAGHAEMTEAVTRYFLDHYVTVCERFNFPTAESDYEEGASFHAPARHAVWVSMWDRGNPQSPLNLYRD